MPIQVIRRREEDRGPSQAERNEYMVGRAFDFAQGAQNIYQEQQKQKQAKQELKEKDEKENALFKEMFGKDISGLSTKNKEEYFAQQLKKQKNNEENNIIAKALRGEATPEERASLDPKHQYDLADREQLELDAKVIEGEFGEKASKIFRSLPVGGRTEFVKHLLDSKSRGIDIMDKIENYDLNKPQVLQPENEEIGPKRPTRIDYDAGANPKERISRQDKRYDKNLPVYLEDEAKIRALQHESQSLESLEELSPKISGSQRLNINPSTGALIVPALASPEAQRFVKTVNDFTVNAKDSFGARVSNFELDRFMQRLPTLANSEEGRRQIIEQMKIINNINLLHKETLQDVIADHGGLRMIDYDQAIRLADKEVRPQIKELNKQYKSIDSGSQKQYDKKIEAQKKIVPKDHVAVQKASGQTGYIPKKDLNKFLKIPGNRAL